MVKRLFDIVASFFGLALLAPLFLVLSVLIKIKMPGPVIFRQERFGQFGKLFIIYKFRTMVASPPGNTVSVQGDHRITQLGSVLRKYKLDELPELWNVLKGEMSFVGPRPDMPQYAARLEGEERLILELKPGITGPASLKYSNEEELLSTVDDTQKYNDEVIWPDKVNINLKYYRESTFAGDIVIILRTIFKKTKNI